VSPAVTVSHHLAHAYGAFGASMFDKACSSWLMARGNYAEDIQEGVKGQHAILKIITFIYQRNPSIITKKGI